jgi:hypothetical protein
MLVMRRVFAAIAVGVEKISDCLSDGDLALQNPLLDRWQWIEHPDVHEMFPEAAPL